MFTHNWLVPEEKHQLSASMRSVPSLSGTSNLCVGGWERENQ